MKKNKERERMRYPVKFHLTYSVILRSAVGIESHHIGGAEIEKESKKVDQTFTFTFFK